MGVIDKQALHQELWNKYCDLISGRKLDEASEVNVAMNIVDYQEEVEAIPISWLKEKGYHELIAIWELEKEGEEK